MRNKRYRSRSLRSYWAVWYYGFFGAGMRCCIRTSRCNTFIRTTAKGNRTVNVSDRKVHIFPSRYPRCKMMFRNYGS